MDGTVDMEKIVGEYGMQAEEKFQGNGQKLRLITDNVPAFIAYVDSDLHYRFSNKSYENWLGKSSKDVIGKHVKDVLGDEAYPIQKERYASVLSGKRVNFEYSLRFSDNKEHYISGSFVPDISDDGEVKGFFVLGTDITERKQAEEQLQIAAAAFETGDGMMITDSEGAILRVNHAFTIITGYTAEEAVGKNPRFLQSGRHNKAFFAAMWESINSTGQWQGEIFDQRKNGEVYPKWLTISAVKDDNDNTTHYVGSHSDITVRKQAEERIRKLAFYDPLTELPNRALFQDRLRQAMTASGRDGRHGALLLIDLDNFKTLNDTRGHATGDKLLKSIAQRLDNTLREGDTVSRLGGDEFMILLPGLSTVKQDAAIVAGKVAEKVRLSISQSDSFGSISHHSTASIGVTLFSGNESSIDDLMKRADLAMYKSKSCGRNTIYFFDPAMETALLKRITLEADLRLAIQENQFLIHYQAQVDNKGRVTGAEALVRWMHPEKGMISPADFIPLAEETGQILLVGQWILEAACARLAEWATRPKMAHLTISVNVSAKQFFQGDFVDQVLTILKDTGANPGRLKLELTESALVENVEGIIETMLALKTRGVRFSLDDFGTGYSSLSYLSRLPLEQLKIDLCFVRDMLADKNAAAIAKAIVGLGESLDMEVMAEGIETKSQQEFLARIGCHRYQGYLYSRPIPAEKFEELCDESLACTSWRVD
ncbi:MAG: EAL domain-containing protein [Porticoccus sp.]|nr:EAL domain-containing protein [Porticoccus sp.]MBQ0806353.1 EAL domain-containing protein [Porticoccus sp.]